MIKTRGKDETAINISIVDKTEDYDTDSWVNQILEITVTDENFQAEDQINLTLDSFKLPPTVKTLSNFKAYVARLGGDENQCGDKFCQI